MEYVTEENDMNKGSRREVKVRLSMDRLAESLQGPTRRLGPRAFHRTFFAGISPEENDTAQQELMKEISKEDFATMRLFGQFNRGFIIAGKPSTTCPAVTEDLFIIDQHATDEKYNFETLQKTQTLQSQNLAIPQDLNLSPGHGALLLSNLSTFTSNGFHFEVTGDTVKLKTIPYSRNWTFGKADIEELLFMLSESDGTVGPDPLRPSRVRQMFASRACRTSVMIGTALDVRAMTKLVRQMGELDQPWHCPHGRPTMRHLVNLTMLRSYRLKSG